MLQEQSKQSVQLKLLKRLRKEALEIADLPELEDNVGDELFIDEFIEKGREKAFVYLEGDLLTGTTHTSIIQDLDIPSKAKMLLNALRMQGITNRHPETNIKFGAGQIFGDVAVIEESTLNKISIDELVSELASNGYKKVYTISNFDDNSIHRLARKVGSKNDN